VSALVALGLVLLAAAVVAVRRLEIH